MTEEATSVSYASLFFTRETMAPLVPGYQTDTTGILINRQTTRNKSSTRRFFNWSFISFSPCHFHSVISREWFAAHDAFLRANDSFLKVTGVLSPLTPAEKRPKKLSVPTRIQPCRKLPQAAMQANKNFLKVAGGFPR